MKRPDAKKETLARLLSGRNEPSVLEKEALLERVHRSSDEGSVPKTWWAGGFFGGLAAAAVLTLAVWSSEPSGAPGGFTAKGAAGPVARVVCTTKPCRAGSTVLIDVSPPLDATYLGAFLQRSDGVVAWILPLPGSETASVGPGRLDTAVRLAKEDPAGVYTLWTFFSKAPVTRAEIEARVDGGQEQGFGKSVFEVQR